MIETNPGGPAIRREHDKQTGGSDMSILKKMAIKLFKCNEYEHLFAIAQGLLLKGASTK